eukprot:4868725-Heterocapsa_arctica.AAC.1
MAGRVTLSVGPRYTAADRFPLLPFSPPLFDLFWLGASGSQGLGPYRSASSLVPRAYSTLSGYRFLTLAYPGLPPASPSAVAHSTFSRATARHTASQALP